MKLLLLDLSALFWWMWFAAKKQQVDTAFEKTVGKVRQLASGASHLAVCCDAGRSFRYDVDPEYKANRPPREEAARIQLAKVIAELKRMGVAVLSADGFEGDDLIATAATWARQQDPPIDVVIAGQDKDLFQLIASGVSLLHIQTGVVVDADAVRKKFGVDPEQLRDYLALVGDTADNIKGIPKVGPESAKRLLNEFGSAAGIYGALHEKDEGGSWRVTPDAVRESFVANVGLLDAAIKLVSLRTDAPILDAFEELDALATSRIGKTPPVAKAEEKAAPSPRPAPAQSRPPSEPSKAPPPRQAPPAAAKPGRFTAASVTRAPDRSKYISFVTGKSGIGKTHFLSTIPGVFIVPVEHVLKGASADHEPARFVDTPRSLAELHQALDMFMELNPVEEGKRKFPHLAVDSLHGIEQLVHDAACGSEHARHMEDKDYKKVWYAAEPFWRKLQTKLDHIRHAGVHVWIAAHSAEVVEADTTSGEIYRRWDIQLRGTGATGVEARQMWRAWLDNIFFLDWVVDVQAGTKKKRSVGKYKGRILHTRESATHYAKTRIRLPPSLPATWEDLAKAWSVGVSAPDTKLRAELDEILPQLSAEDRDAIEAELVEATGNRLAALVSRAHGMLAVALDDMPTVDAAE